MYNKAVVSIILNNERLNMFPLKSRIRQGNFRGIQYCPSSLTISPQNILAYAAEASTAPKIF